MAAPTPVSCHQLVCVRIMLGVLRDHLLNLKPGLRKIFPCLETIPTFPLQCAFGCILQCLAQMVSGKWRRRRKTFLSPINSPLPLPCSPTIEATAPRNGAEGRAVPA